MVGGSNTMPVGVRSVAGTVTLVVIGMLTMLLLLAAVAPVRRAAPSLAWATLSSNIRFAGPQDLRALRDITLVEPFGFEPALLTAKAQTARLAAAARLAQLATRENAFIPLRYAEGVYWARVCLEDNKCAQAVVDTGSSNLVISTTTCMGCDHTKGNIHLPPQHLIVDTDRELHFGSQTVVADIALVRITLAGHDLDDAVNGALLHNADAALQQAQTAQTALAVQTAAGAAAVFATKRMTGDTAANVLGLAPSPSSSPRSMLETLHTDGAPQEFGIMLGGGGGVWVPGPPPTSALAPRDRIVHVPIVRPPWLQNQPSLFYMTPLLDVLVGPTPASMRSVLTSLTAPRNMFLMLDTGSTMTYTSAGLQGPILAAKAASGAAHPCLALVLPNNVFLLLTPATYMLDTATSSIDLHEPFVDELLRCDGVLLGCIAMRGLYIHHDATRQRLGFAALHRSFA
jgi:hypothetical protein